MHIIVIITVTTIDRNAVIATAGEDILGVGTGIAMFVAKMLLLLL